MRLYVYSLWFIFVPALLIPVSASAQESADCAAVHDVNGTRVGRLQPAGDLGRTSVLLKHGGRVAQIVFERALVQPGDDVFFTGANCTGDAFMNTSSQVIVGAQVVGTDVWYPDMSAADISGQPFESTRDRNGVCTNGANVVSEVVPAYTFTMPIFTPPFHLEPEACFTPTPAVAALTPYGLGAMALVLAFGSYLMVRRPQAA